MNGAHGPGDAPIRSLPADEPARERIRTDLETNLLVEAGAGSGKTTMLVDRMLRLLSTGAVSVDGMAAVTFTRKAAGELRQRLQQGLEASLGELPPESPEAGRLRAALHDLDTSFAGTIHAFCARLLRERPLEAGVDPGFRELMTPELMRMARRFWSGFLERRATSGDPVLEEMERAGLQPGRFRDLFFLMMDNLDVEFPTPEADPPEPFQVARMRARLEELLDRGLRNLPDTEPSSGWDSGQRIMRDLRFARRFPGWEEDTHMLDSLARVCNRKSFSLTQNRWTDPREAKAFKEIVNEFIDPEGPASQLLIRWQAYRYPLIIRFVREAAVEFREHRRREGLLSFQDLLEGAATLLRTHPEARRDLGERYRRVLVDEFQDTDPIQAELLFLLASEPVDGESGDPHGERGWDAATPRPGSLFVVGDPKQSIYRFRRADIALYGFVKDRFREFGDVLSLTTNFRSTPAIGGLVNAVFQGDHAFPDEETAAQAAFAPLQAWRPEAGGGARAYRVRGATNEDMAVDDAARVASYVRTEVEAGRRRPADFLILTRVKRSLAQYARALEARNLPVQVTGAGVGVEEELQELVLLLRALVDPGDSVLTVAALTGLFMGLDPDALLDFREQGGVFDVRWTHPAEGAGAPVAAALNRLHTLWRRSRVEPADVFISSLAGELGLLTWAASGPLGSLRAGAMAYALDAVRFSASSGETSLPAALEALEAALEVDEAETPLEPLRGDSVRLMNLHQAKGLEAAVVILADPTPGPSHPPDRLIERVGARAVGWFAVEEKGETWYAPTMVVARPRVWEEKRKIAEVFDAAEEVRLQYVAATRAREELLVACPMSAGRSPWAPLSDWLVEQGLETHLEVVPEPPRDELQDDPAALMEAGVQAGREIARSRRPSYASAPVTVLARGGGAIHTGVDETPPARAPGSPGGGATPAGMDRSAAGEGDVAAPANSPDSIPSIPGGVGWGSAVHEALALAGRGVSGEALRSAARTVLLELERPVDETGEALELDELLRTVDAVRASALWTRARSADRCLIETPFALPGMRLQDRARWAGSLPDVVEGVVDLAFQERGGWVIADYKTDRWEGTLDAARGAAYREQVDLYAACWEILTAEPVVERIILFTRTGREDRW